MIPVRVMASWKWDGLLAGGGVGDEKGFARVDELVKVFELFNEPLVDFLTACGVKDEGGEVLRLGPFEGVFSDFDEILFGSIGGVAGNLNLVG